MLTWFCSFSAVWWAVQTPYEDLTFTANFLEIKIRSSKTDQYRQGDTVLMACTGKPTCPISMVERYMTIGELVGKSGLLFHPLMRNGKKLRPNGSLTYSRLRELLLDRLRVLGYYHTTNGPPTINPPDQVQQPWMVPLDHARLPHLIQGEPSMALSITTVGPP